MSDKRVQSVLWACLILVACGTKFEPSEVSAESSSPAAAVRYAASSGFACPPSETDGSIRTYPIEDPGSAIGQNFPDFQLGIGFLNLTGALNEPSNGREHFSMHDLYCSGFKLALVHIGTSWCSFSQMEIADLRVRQKAWLPKGGLSVTILEDDQLALVRGRFPFDYTLAVDPMADIDTSFGVAIWPTNFIIQLSNMQIVDEHVGYDGSGDAFVAEFESLLDLLH